VKQVQKIVAYISQIYSRIRHFRFTFLSARTLAIVSHLKTILIIFFPSDFTNPFYALVRKNGSEDGAVRFAYE